MSVMCDLCNDAGRLRDGSACPWCNAMRWQTATNIPDIAQKSVRLGFARRAGSTPPRTRDPAESMRVVQRS